MNSTAVRHPRPPVSVETPELSFDEVAAWLDEVLAILEATSAVVPFDSVGLQRWALDQLTPFEAVVPWLTAEIDEAYRLQDAEWLLLRVDAAMSMLRAHLAEGPPLAA